MESAFYFGYSGTMGSMESVATDMGIEGKFAEGRRAMLELTRLGTEVNDYRKKLELCGKYCLADVKITLEIFQRLGSVADDSDFEQHASPLSREINSRGIPIDVKHVDILLGAVEKFDIESEPLIKELSGGTLKRADLNRVAFMRTWLKTHGLDLPNMQAETIENALAIPDLDKNIHSILMLKKTFSQSSLKKLGSMKATAGEGNRVRGAIQYYGAHTGRDSGRLIQPQNFPRACFGSISEFDEYIEKVKKYVQSKKTTLADLPILEDMPKAVRGLIKAGKGNTFVIADYAQIEARVNAWLAGQSNICEVFKKGEDVYCVMASSIYGKPINKKEHPTERQIGKISCLALQYSMGADKFREAVGKAPYNIKVTEQFAKNVVNKYRLANAKIVGFWKALQDCFYSVIVTKEPVDLALSYAKITIRFSWSDKVKGVRIQLPSGRSLYYPETFVKPGKYGPEIHWLYGYIYGGILCENIVQAVSRDIMVYCTLYKPEGIILKVHDEIVWEVSKKEAKEKVFRNIMTGAGCPPWFPKELIDCEINISERYGK